MASYQDKTLTCRECGAEFVFTAGEQEFYSSKGLRHEPGRCAICRAGRRERRPESTGRPRAPGASLYSRAPRRQLYSAVCSQCGGSAVVPFTPRGDRPVYCSGCYARVRQQV